MKTIAEMGCDGYAIGGLAVGEETEVSMALRLTISVDGVQRFSAELTRPGTYKNFSVDLAHAKTLTIKLEPIVDNFIYYEDAKFMGGLVNAVLYEN